LQSVDHRELPQRAVAIEHAFVQFPHGRLELRLGARRGKREGLDVILEIDGGRLQPHRIGEVDRHEASLRENTGARCIRPAMWSRNAV